MVVVQLFKTELLVPYVLQLFAILWKAGVRSWRKSFSRFINNIRNGLYPASHRSLVLVWAVLYGGELSRRPGLDFSFGASSRVEEFIPKHLAEVHPNLPRCLAVFVTGIGMWSCLSVFRRYMLKALFSYKGWMYETRGKGNKVSLATRLWFLAVRIFEGSSPLLYSYQSCLPSLPLPSVADTMQRYLKSVKALNSDEEYKRLSQLAKEFQAGPGRRFQRYLWFKSWWAPNYVSDWWEEFIYLRGRGAIMVNSNFYASDAILMKVTTNQCARAANLIHAAFLFRREIDFQSLKPIILQGVIPLCSAQYARLFNTTRVPGMETDKIRHSHDSTHIALYHKGRYFKIITHYKGRLLYPPELQRQLEQVVVEDSKPSSAELYLGALTATDRVTWAQTRKNHFRRGINKPSLDAIEKAAFVVILDDEDLIYDAKDPSKLDRYAQLLLHGKGFDRWYDKSFNMIVGKNARAGVNVEHSWADAPVAGHCWEFCIYTDHAKLGYDEDGNTKGYNEFNAKELSIKELPRPIRLKWDINDECQNTILKAKADAEKILSDVDLHVEHFADYGKRVIKKCRVSPDAYLQMALQLAYFRDQGNVVIPSPQTYSTEHELLSQYGTAFRVESLTFPKHG